MLIRGGESDLVPDSAVAQMTEIIPQFQSVDVAEAGHQVHGDKPAIFIQTVDDFLKQLTQ